MQRKKIKCQSNRVGFTLIELLVVVSIIGFLATLIVLSVSDSRTKAYDTRRLSDINDFLKALEFYNADFEVYPSGSSLILGGASAGCLSEDGFTSICPANKRVYLGAVPANPGSGGIDYTYNQVLSGASYTIDFRTETNISDIPAGDHVLVPNGIQ